MSPRQQAMTHRFVEYVPDELEDGVLYVSIPFATVSHRCCCGCRHEVVTPLTPTDWSLTFDGESVSLTSIWHNASHRFRRLYASGVPPPNKHGLRLPAANVDEFLSSTSQGLPPDHRSPCPFTPVKELGDFLLATRSLSFEFQTPRSTKRGTALPGRPQKRFLR